jgi:hypothetical protein
VTANRIAAAIADAAFIRGIITWRSAGAKCIRMK